MKAWVIITKDGEFLAKKDSPTICSWIANRCYTMLRELAQEFSNELEARNAVMYKDERIAFE